MKRSLRLAALVAIGGVAAFSIWRLCWLPYACNRVKAVAALQLHRITSAATTVEGTRRLRAASEQVERCLRRTPHDVDLNMEAAACDRLLGLNSEAEAHYAAALQVDRRPEIYLEMGSVQYESGHRAAAIYSFGRALSFATFFVNYDPTVPWSGERTLDLVPPELIPEIQAEAMRQTTELARRPRRFRGRGAP
jgi:hypothetical protein